MKNIDPVAVVFFVWFIAITIVYLLLFLAAL